MIAADPIPVEPAALADTKAYLRIDGSDEDAQIGRLIAAAIGHGETFLARTLIARAMRETVAIVPDWRRLGATPVRAISAVAALDAAGAETVLPVEGYGIDIDAAGDGWVWVRGMAGPAAGLPGGGRLRVTYTAGMTTGWSGLPEPIAQGVVRLAAHLFTHRDAADEAAPPAAVAALWRPWRRMRLA